MSDLTRDDVIEMLQGIFEEQRELTDEVMQAYKDMLRRKENDMGRLKSNAIIHEDEAKVKTERKDQATLIAELISRVNSLEEDMEFVLKHIKILDATIKY